MKMSLRGVVENLEDTPSSQVRAFWRETSGAADTMSLPTAIDAYDLDDSPIRRPSASDLRADGVDRFRMSDAAMAVCLDIYCV